jgi:flagellar secretion chaperone FliS
MSYASLMCRDPRETYRAVDVASRTGGATPHGLISILYEDVLRELRLGALAIEKGDHAAKNARLTKAIALLFALEAGLDFERGGSVAEALSRFYRGCRDAVMRASVENNPKLVREAVTSVTEIADSWKAIAAL